ncbi:MAG: ATP-binding protein [Spirochaetales bacterium]|nr:MAG: ATP-binding protein [Spirochaetales bacterium]
MVKRDFWINKIERLWKNRSVIWLSGVRRVGKTCLCRSLENIEYFDCELPSTRRIMESPEMFLKSAIGKRIVIDEIHRLSNPSELLKISADHFPALRIIATGSSTLSASAKFKDTLTGRKESLLLTPLLCSEPDFFKNFNLEDRMLKGGLPQYFLQDSAGSASFQEWLDSYWAKDIQELFRLEKRHAFMKLLELVFLNSGGMFEATRYAKPCEISRPTVGTYLDVLETTSLVHIIRPFNTKRKSEIVSAPKVYAFDTGFVCFNKGIESIRRDDYGLLWEHLVLNEIIGRLQTKKVYYWRDKQGHEIDFILRASENAPLAVECKWSAEDASPSNLIIFRKLYPEGKNFIVGRDIIRPYTRDSKGILITYTNLEGLIRELEVSGRFL